MTDLLNGMLGKCLGIKGKNTNGQNKKSNAWSYPK